MLALFLAFSLSFRTSYFGRPIQSIIRGDVMLIYSTEGVLASVEETTGELIWRQRLSKILAIEMSDQTVAVSKHYYYIIDNETGVLLHQFKHNIKQPNHIAINKGLVVITGASEIGVYNKTVQVWIQTHSSEVNIRPMFMNDGSISYGNSIYSSVDGSITISETSTMDQVLDLKYEPTALEYYKDNSLKWRIDEPLYGSIMREHIGKGIMLFTNDTHLILFSIPDEKIVTIKEVHVFDTYQLDNGLVLSTNSEFLYVDYTSHQISTFNKTVHTKPNLNNKIQCKDTQVLIPPNCTQLCMKAGRGKSLPVMSVSQCGSSMSIIITDKSCSIKYNSYSVNAEFGTCWTTSDSFAVSYKSTYDHKYYVNSFGFENQTQKSYQTPNLVIASSPHAFVDSYGTIHKTANNPFSAYNQFGQGSGGFLQSLFSSLLSGNAEYQPFLEGAEQHYAYDGVKYVSDIQDQVIVKGLDVIQIGESLNNSMLYYIIMGIAFIGALWFALQYYSSTKSQFWQ